MINPGDREKFDQRRWQARFARGRQGLSASVEEALANPNLSEKDFDDDLEDGSLEQVETDKVTGQSNQMLIRPRLSLQSKPLPIVRAPPHPDDRQVAQDSTPAVATNATAKAAQPASKKKRLAGRNTRVELQAIPKQEKKASRKTTPLTESKAAVQALTVEGESPHKEAVTEEPSVVKVEQRVAPPREKLSGTGKLLKGCAEATVENPHITFASLVLVTLLSDPGPVVVQYFTLLPGYGFTVHLSAPVGADTAFNYVILLGELL
jgi:hypothetical protein